MNGPVEARQGGSKEDGVGISSGTTLCPRTTGEEKMEDPRNGHEEKGNNIGRNDGERKHTEERRK